MLNMIRGIVDYCKKTLSKLGKTGFFHVFGSSVLNKIITFASGIVLVRILSKEQYGVYTYANNILSFCVLASGFGVVSGVLQMCSEAKESVKRIEVYRFGCRFGLGFNILLTVVIIAIGALIPLPISGSNRCLIIMSLLPLAQLFSDLQRTFLRTELRNREYGFANTFSTVVTFVFACSLSYLFKIEGLIVAHYIAAISTALLIIFRYKVPFSIKQTDLDTKEKRELLNISWISMLNGGLSRLMYLLDIFVLGIVIPNESVVASYKIATNIPTALVFIPSSVVVYVYPYFARNKDNRDWLFKNYRRLTIAMGAVNACISSILFLFAPIIIKIVFGAQYLDAVVPFRILSVSYGFSGTFRIIAGNLLVTQRKLKFNLFVAVFSSLCNTIMNVFFIQAWGSPGAAIATLITVMLTSALNTWYLIKTFKGIGRAENIHGKC